MTKTVYTPLSSTFMAISIIGFFISIWLFNWETSLGATWGFTFLLFFLFLFISSFISMSKAEATPEHMEELAIHEHYKNKKKVGHIHHLIEKLEEKKKPNKFMWHDGIMLLYGLVYLYYIIQAVTNPLTIAQSAIYLPIFVITLLMMIWMVIDIISSKKLTLIAKTLLTLIVIILSGLGVLIYYGYRRLKNDFGD